MDDTLLSNTGCDNLQSGEIRNCINTQFKDNNFDDQNVQTTKSTKQINENKVDNDNMQMIVLKRYRRRN